MQASRKAGEWVEKFNIPNPSQWSSADQGCCTDRLHLPAEMDESRMMAEWGDMREQRRPLIASDAKVTFVKFEGFLWWC